MGLGSDGLIGIEGRVGGVVGLSAKTNVDAKSERIKRVNFFIVTLFDSLTHAVCHKVIYTFYNKCNFYVRKSSPALRVMCWLSI